MKKSDRGLGTKLLRGNVPYDGSPLGPHWAYLRHGVQGDSLLAFAGPCEVRVEALADLEDAKAGAFIYSPLMLHFVLELFGASLEEAVARQWLMASTVAEVLAARGVERRGNDLYAGRRKLSVSIAAPTPVSVKVHLGINISAKGAPVPALGLQDLKVPVLPFTKLMLNRFSEDHAKLRLARTKVRLYV